MWEIISPRRKMQLPARLRRVYSGANGVCAVLAALGIFGLFGATMAGRAQHPDIRFQYERYDTDGIPNEVYAARRQKVLAAMADSGVAVFFSADVRNRQNDVDYEYRQDNFLWYLTGMHEAGSVLILAPGGIRLDSAGAATCRELLLVKRRNPRMEIWTGVGLGPETAQEVLGVEKTADADRYLPLLEGLLAACDTLYISSWPTPYLENPAIQTREYPEETAEEYLREQFPHVRFASLYTELVRMREIKDAHEMRLMRKAVSISRQGHLETMRRARPGMYEYELEAIMEYTFHRLGAQAAGYPSIVGSCPNACILHYTENRRATRAGELVLMDCGAEYHGYTADITRTFPISGTFSREQGLVYELVLEARDSAIAACRAGNNWQEPHKAAQRVISRGLKRLGIMGVDGDVHWYFMHGTSHFLGLDVHDPNVSAGLQAGMVLTVEPGIYIPAGSPCNERWWNIGVRIEDNIHITEQGPEVLTADLPAAIGEIESLMAAPGKQGSR